MTFYKIDEEQYYMDFSVEEKVNNKKPEATKLPTFCYSLILASTDG